MLPPRVFFALYADTQLYWTPCGSRLHRSCEGLEEANDAFWQFSDVADRELLINKLKHRVKNTITKAQPIAA